MFSENDNIILSVFSFFGIGTLILFVVLLIYVFYVEIKEYNFEKTHVCVKTKWVEQTCTNATNKGNIRTYDCSYEACIEYRKIEKE